MFASFNLDTGHLDEGILDSLELLKEGYNFVYPPPHPPSLNLVQSCSTAVGHILGSLCRNDSERKHVATQGILTFARGRWQKMGWYHIRSQGGFRYLALPKASGICVFRIFGLYSCHFRCTLAVNYLAMLDFFFLILA